MSGSANSERHPYLRTGFTPPVDIKPVKNGKKLMSEKELEVVFKRRRGDGI